MKAKVAPEEYFLFSRFDGKQTLRDVLLESGLPMDRAIAIVAKLRGLGALLLPAEITPPAATPEPVKPATPRTAEGSKPPGLDTTLPDPTPDELRLLTEDSVLTDVQRRRILAIARLLDKRDPWALLGVPHGADARTLKLAYFKLSKDIHPDRFFGKQLGSFVERLSTVFEAVSRAYERLTSPENRACTRNQAVVERRSPKPLSRRRSTRSSCSIAPARSRSPATIWGR